MKTKTLAEVFATELPMTEAAPAYDPERTLAAVALPDIVPSRWQPRKQFDVAALYELATDIAQHGILTPPLVWLNEDMEYELIAGERRLRATYALFMFHANPNGNRQLDSYIAEVAAQGFASWRLRVRQLLQAQRERLPGGNLSATAIDFAFVTCRLVSGPVAELHELALVDNLQRADLTPIEEAHALADLLQEYNYSQRDLAARLGKSQTWISQRLNLLALAPELVDKVAGGELDSATARELARLDPAVQPQALAHLQAHDIKSKAAQKFVGRLLELADPATIAAAAPSTRAAARLARNALEQLETDEERQAAVLRYAGMANGGQLKPPDESHHFRDLIAATRAAPDRYSVNLTDTWAAQAPELGYTCANCQLNPHRAEIAAINALVKDHRDTSSFNDSRWPACAPDRTTCHAFTGPADALELPLVWLGSDFAFTAEEQPHIGEYRYGSATADDVAVWAAIIRRKYAAADLAAATISDRHANAVVTALTAYVEAQAEISTLHFWSQSCHRCVFHKVGATDPGEACQLQANPPASDNYGADSVARLWQSGNAPPIGRCRLFRLKSPADNLPDLPGGCSGLDAPGLDYLLRQLSGQNSAPAAWLDLPRSKPWLAPAWRDASAYLEKLIPNLAPGQRLSLLLLWKDPFGYEWTHPGRPTEATAYMPTQGRAMIYTVQRDIKRD